jgi:hypothetical protein
MTRVGFVLIVGLAVASCGRTETPPAETATPAPAPAATGGALIPVWTVTEGIETPESVYYLKGQVIRVSSSGETQPVGTFTPGTADIGLNGSTVIIPHMNENKVAAYNLP